jgi:hypothetical protein
MAKSAWIILYAVTTDNCYDMKITDHNQHFSPKIIILKKDQCLKMFHLAPNSSKDFRSADWGLQYRRKLFPSKRVMLGCKSIIVLNIRGMSWYNNNLTQEGTNTPNLSFLLAELGNRYCYNAFPTISDQRPNRNQCLK